MGKPVDSNQVDDVGLAQAGDRDAFCRLVMQYQDKILSLLTRSVGDRSVAEELAQDTFVKAYGSIRKFQHRSEFSTWLVRIALNSSNSYFASRRYKEHAKTASLAPEHTRQLTASPGELTKEADIQKLHRAIAQLSPQLRDALVLCALEGESYEAAAEVLGIPVGTVRSRLHAAKKALRIILTEGAGQ